MANQTVYPYGTNGSLPSSVGIVNDLITGGSDKALSAEQGKIINSRFLSTFFTSSSSTTWNSGNISNGKIVTTYANRYYVLSGFPSGVDKLVITRATPPDNTYYLNVYGSSDGTNYTNLEGFGKVGGTKEYVISGYTHILFLLWDKPSSSRAQDEVLTVRYDVGNGIGMNDLKESLFDGSDGASSIKIVRQMADDVWVNTLIPNSVGFYWEKGGLNGSTGAEEANQYAVRSNWIPVRSIDQAFLSNNSITGFNFIVIFYDDEKTRLGNYYSFGDLTAKIRELFSTDESGYFRMVYYNQIGVTRKLNPTDSDVLAMRIKITSSLSAGENTSGYYNNPVVNLDMPDPCVIDGENGYLYMLCTGMLGSRVMYRTTNLIDWEPADSPFTSAAVSSCFSDLNVSSVNFWAPEIVKVGDKYNMYISKGSTPMLVFQSSHPYFGYEYRGQIITTSNGLAGDNIDACVRYDLEGNLWIFWGSTYGIYRQKLATDGLSLDTSDTKEHVAGNLLSSDNTRATVFEGSYLYRRDGYWYLFVSAGTYSSYTYCLKVGRCATIDGNFVDKEGNNMSDGYATTILSSSSSDTFYGPGHNGSIITDKNNRTYMLYHSHYSGASSSSVRVLCLQEIKWDENGWPYFDNSGKPQLVNIKPSL